MTFDRRLRAALAAILLTFMSTFALGTVDRAICTTADAGGTCSGAEVVTSANEEIAALDNRAPMNLGSLSGTDTYLASVTPTLTAYADKQSFWFKPPNANTGASTLNIDTIGAKDLVSRAGAALGSGDLVTTTVYLVVYYSTSDQFRVISDLGSGSDDDVPEAGDFTNLALSGDVVSAALVTTIQANSVALTTDTTGNYAAGDAEAGAALTGDSATAFFSTGSIEDARLTLKTESICVAASDESTNLTTGTAKTTFHIPYAFTLTGVSASVNTAPTGSTIIIDINEDPDAEGGGSASATILSTKLTIDASERRSSTAAAAAVISDTALGADAEMTIDLDQVGSSTPGKGAKVCLIGHQ